MRLSCTVMEIYRLKDNGVTSLTFWGHVTSSVTSEFDSWESSSYPWSIWHRYRDMAPQNQKIKNLPKNLLRKPSYSQFCPKFRCHGNRAQWGQPGVNINATIN